MTRPTPIGPDARLRAAVAHLDAPLAVLDLDAFDANLDALAARAGGVPVRIASKSLRCVDAIERALAHPGVRGVLAFTLPEALALAERGIDDLVVAYPATEAGALRRLAGDASARRCITLMIDQLAHLDRIAAALDAAEPHAAAPPIRVAIDVDASYRPLERVSGGRVHVGVRRSPVRTPAEAAALARAVAARPAIELAGLMFYEAQIAGVADGARGPMGAAVRWMQARSDRELRTRRGPVVRAVEAALRDAGAPPLAFVNGGGTGSLERTAADRAVTELAAGSGAYGPALFDGYRGFRPRPAAFAVFAVARRPTPRVATLLGGGWIASGPPGTDRQPAVAWPAGLRPLAAEGFGEVQTPLRGAAAERLRPGDRVWLRHAKAGELAERVRAFAVVSGGALVGEWPTYRGDGWAFV